MNLFFFFNGPSWQLGGLTHDNGKRDLAARFAYDFTLLSQKNEATNKKYKESDD